jgi:hypothetical protein
MLRYYGKIYSDADPDPASGVFLTPGTQIRNIFSPVFVYFLIFVIEKVSFSSRPEAGEISWERYAACQTVECLPVRVQEEASKSWDSCCRQEDSS